MQDVWRTLVVCRPDNAVSVAVASPRPGDAAPSMALSAGWGRPFCPTAETADDPACTVGSAPHARGRLGAVSGACLRLSVSGQRHKRTGRWIPSLAPET